MRVSPEVIGRWIELPPDDQTGAAVRIRFEANGYTVQRRIPERIMQAVQETCASHRDLLRKGKLVGNTQRHFLKIGSLPLSLKAHLERKLGPTNDPDAAKNWKRFWNDSDNRKFRSSEHRL